MAAVQFMAIALCVAGSVAVFQVAALLLEGFFVGFVITLHSYAHVSAMVTFFVTSSALTKFSERRKRKPEADCEEGGRRTWQQVVCNGGVAVLLALFSFIGAPDVVLGAEKRLWMKRRGGFDRALWYDLAILGSIASAAGDTWASEIGTGVGSGEPWLVTNFRRVPRGTNGAISLLGTAASVAGGATVGAAYWLTIVALASPYRLLESEYCLPLPQWIIVVICAFFGAAGSVIDSLLGATLQYSGCDTKTGRVVEQPGPDVRRIAGRACLDNNSVNLFSSLMTGLLAPSFAEIICSRVV